MREKTLAVALAAFLFSTSSFAMLEPDRHFALKGGIGAASITWLGPLSIANIKLAAGAEYWFTSHWALGLDLGLGGEGFGKAIGVTSDSIINLKTGDFVLDPGISVLGAFSEFHILTPYIGLRFGFPMRSGFGAGMSLTPSVGGLIAFNKWVALDLNVGVNVVANFQFTYLATTLSLGSVGFRVFL